MDSGFETWLFANHYRPSTTRKTLADVERAREVFTTRGALRVGSWQESLRRYSTYVVNQELDRGPFEAAVVKAVPASTRKHHAPKAGRKHPAVSFADGEFGALVDRVAGSSDPESRVLYLTFATGYRIGDVLGIERVRLVRALRSGVLQIEIKTGRTLEVPVSGLRDVWEQLLGAWPAEHPTLASWVCPRSKFGALAGRGAYQAVRRHFQKIARELDIDSRVHLHRIRRTVGVRALRASRDIHLVSQLLGHKTIAATETYVDELRRDDVAAMQQKLRRQREEREERQE